MLVTILTFAALTWLLVVTRGHFHPLAVVVSTGLAIAYAAWLTLNGDGRFVKTNDSRVSLAVLSSVVLINALVRVLNPGPIYLPDLSRLSGISLLWYSSLGLGAVLTASWAIGHLRGKPFLARWAFRTSWIYYPGISVLVLLLVPQPFIDVFYFNTLGADHLLAGQNPYAFTYPDIYHGRYTYTVVYFYFPVTLLWMTLGRLLGDVRLVSIIAIWISAAATYKISHHRGHTEAMSQGLSLLLLFHPVGLFVLEQAWSDTLLLMLWSLSSLAAARGRSMIVWSILGIAAAAKQYAFAAMGPFFSWMWRSGTPMNIIRGVTAGFLVATGFFLPFILWDARALYGSTIQSLIDLSFRPDALTLPSLFNYWFGYFPPGWLLCVLYVIIWVLASIWTFKRSKSAATWLDGVVLTFWGFFLLGKQAFCNYYFLISGVLLLSIADRPVTFPAPSVPVCSQAE